jgi:ABC-2 type transport system permease protein
MSDRLDRPLLTPASAVVLIARREFVTRVRTRVFIIGTALILVAIAGYVVLQATVLSKQGNVNTYKVAYLSEAQSLADPLAASAKALGLAIERRPVNDESQAQSELKKGDLDVLIRGSASAPQALVRDQLSPTLHSLLLSIVRQRALDSQLTAAGLNPAAVEASLASATVQVQTLQPLKPVEAGHRIEVVIAGFAVALFLYVALLTYGQFIAQGVVEEKANRIVEILLSTVKPYQLLIGKVVGVGAVGLLQLGVISVFAFVLITLTGAFTVPPAAAGVLVYGLIWFILGYFFYAVLFAAAGSLVSRTEEVQSVALPVTMLAIIAWLVAIGVLTPMFDGSPMSTLGIVLALIPFISPVIMPTGMATGDISPWLALLGIALTLLLSAAATWLAARIYANSVLRLGARVKLRDALGAR